MLFPSIVGYLEIVGNLSRFRTLRFLPEQNQAGECIFTPGNMAVIFSVFDQYRKRYALKCYTRECSSRNVMFKAAQEYFARQKPSPYFSLPHYIENEIYTCDIDGQPIWLPVTVSEWINGRTLKECIQEFAYLGQKDLLAEMTDRFLELTLFMLDSEWAHGDIKPDNIIVTTDGSLKLIDADTLYTPNTPLEESPEIGTPQYQHPLRNNRFFNRHTDDYSLLIILTSLLIIEQRPELWEQYSNGENLLFDPLLIFSNQCVAYNHIRDCFKNQVIISRLLDLLKSPEPKIETLKGLVILIAGLRPNLREAFHLTITQDVSAITGTAEQFFNEKGLCGYLIDRGKSFIDPIFDDGDSFCCGMAPVAINQKWGYIDTKGRAITPFIYKQAQVFSEGYAATQTDYGKWVILNDRLQAITEIEAEYIGVFHEGLAPLKHNGVYGFIAPDGVIRIKPDYLQVKSFHNGLAIVCHDEKWGIINRNGQWVIFPVHDFIRRDAQGNPILK